MDSRQELIRQIEAANHLLYRKARHNFKTFVQLSKPDYSMQWFHSVVCDKLQQFSEGKIKKLMILMPPQHGKSELATRQFPAFHLGRKPNTKFAIASYAQSMASKFNRSIQRNIDNEVYGEIFPDTKLNNSQVFSTFVPAVSRTDKLVEIIGHQGSITTVGRGGPLTGQPVDIGIIDDLYKDRNEAVSPTISESAWSWYTDVFMTRLHNDSQQLLMNTRWDNLDLAGRLLELEGSEWEVVIFTGIRTRDEYPYDIRLEGEALWPGKHSLARLLKIKEDTEITFNSLYQQQPGGSKKLLIFPEVYEVLELPKADHYFWGLDLGKTVSKTVLTKGCSDHENVYGDECCYQPDLSAKEIHTLLMANGYEPGEPLWCDHKPSFINELRLPPYFINAVNAIKTEGSVIAGINKLKDKRIHITKRSVNARREANNYRFVAVANIITNIPDKKGFEHFWDSFRYGYYGDTFIRPKG